MSTSTKYLRPPPGYRFRRPLYSRPEFYIPVGIVIVIAAAFVIYISILMADLQGQASSFDLSKLEQMESASMILDRNGKIFGQIYVENRETVPYDQLPRDLINAVVAVEDAKFYEHGGYDLLGIVRAALKNLTAGHVRQGALYAPTVVDRVLPDMQLVKEETFGPVSPVIRFAGIDEAIAMSNSTAYGLSSSVCTNRLDYITRFISELNVGTVNVREVPGYRLELTPFGGIKDSGLGYKEGVLEAMKSFTNVKTYSLPW